MLRTNRILSKNPAIIFSGVFGVLGAIIILSTFAATPAETYYAAANGSGTTCSNGSPCTLSTAWGKSTAGDTVLLKTGNYGNQTFNNNAANDANSPNAQTEKVTIKPNAGATVTMNNISWCGADNVILEGSIAAQGFSTYNCPTSLAHDVVIDGLNIDNNYNGFDDSSLDGSVFGIYGNAKNWVVKNMDMKRGYNVKGFYMSSWTQSGTPYYPTNINLENSSIGDWSVSWKLWTQFDPDDYVHTECFFANKVQGLTLRGNHFYNCVSTGDGIVGDTGNAAETLHPSNFLFENNVFERPWNGPQAEAQTVSAHGPAIDGFTYDTSTGSTRRMSGQNVFRYNIFEAGMFSQGNAEVRSDTTVDFYGNVGAPPPCNQITHSWYNVWTNSNLSSCAKSKETINEGTPQEQIVPRDLVKSDALSPSSNNFLGLLTRPSTAVVPAPANPTGNYAAPGDWHYKTGAYMIGKGNPDNNCSSFGVINGGSSPCRPSTDKDGNARTGTPDAGPYQLTSVAPDTTPPDTNITTQPSSSTSSTTADFSFNSTESGSTFECKLDSGSYSSCTSPKQYTGLSTGSHTFSVRATDSSGNTDASPDTYTWTVTTAGTAPSNTASPTVSGTIAVGNTVTVGNGTWSGSTPLTYTYQWQRCDNTGSNCAVINSIGTTTPVTTNNYKLSCFDYKIKVGGVLVKPTIKVRVTATNSAGSANNTVTVSTSVPKPSTPAKGDFNDDCFVDSDDATLFVGKWRNDVTTGSTYDISGPPVTVSGNTTNPPDGHVDTWDLNILVGNYGYRG